MKRIILLISVLGTLCACNGAATGETMPNAVIDRCTIGGGEVSDAGHAAGVPLEGLEIELTFSEKADIAKLDSELVSFSPAVEYSLSQGSDDKSIVFKIEERLQYYTSYSLELKEGENFGLKIIGGARYWFVTELDETPKFPKISQDELLTKVEQQTFKYFWDYAHPVSGLSRERLGSDDTVTSGGSGFGIMTIPVGIERGFITRAEGYERMTKIVDFLSDKAVRCHGAYSHWLNGATGAIIPFSSNDDGADLVETAYLIQGLLAARQYFSDPSEKPLRDKITSIWESVEWDWFTQGGQKALYWHWSPNCGWKMNMQIRGWNECLIVYVLAASSPTHPISAEVYDNGWASNGGFKNGKKFYDITLPLGSDYGGPLFFAHYSFLGLDPRNLSDKYASYWEQNTAHTLINRAYCVKNPRGYMLWGPSCWGLTASDYPKGYTASSPTNTDGTITPTAALSSFPYTPKESMEALEYFYYVLGDKIFKQYGFIDSFNLGKRWFAGSFLAIDQGPIVVMIENYRTQLLWNCFMANDEIKAGLTKLGFEY